MTVPSAFHSLRRGLRARLDRGLAPWQQYAPLALFAGIYLGLSLLLRIVLWGLFDPAADTSLWHLLAILAIGVVNDAVESVYLLLPFTLLLLVLPRRWSGSRIYRAVLGVGFSLALFGLLYLIAAEYYFFEEFNARFNLVAVSYVLYATEVLTNIWDSYPVVPVLVGAGLASALGVALLAPWLLRRWEPGLPWRRRLVIAAAHTALLLLAIGFYSTDGLARFRNRVDNEVAANGTSSLFRAIRTWELDYDRNYRTGDPARLRGLLREELGRDGGRFIDPDESRLTRHYGGNPHGLGRLNVVVIVEESLSAEFVGAYGSSYGLTPELDRLAGQGLLFTHTYASGTRTVRGLEAISASFPPIPTESIVKRPGSEHIANWGAVMRASGYHTEFLYGGYGYFDNMNHYFGSNDYEVLDRTNIADQTYANIWGVCDEDLFRFAVRHFDEDSSQHQPFFTVIMSTSNHKPFTFPGGVPGVPPEGGGRAAGVRYADYAIGRFFRMAQSHDWFADTLVVIVADHGARVYGAEQIPMHSYRIPLLMVSPAHLKAGRVDDAMGQMEIAPTVLGLLGLPYDAPFFGQDVLALHGKPHPILLNHNFDVALMEAGQMVVLGLDNAVHSYTFDMGSNEFLPAPQDARLVDLATAYYQTAYEDFKHHAYQ